MDSRFSCEMCSLTLSSSSLAVLWSKVLNELVVLINFYCSFKSNYEMVSITIIFDYGSLALFTGVFSSFLMTFDCCRL